MAIIAQIPWNSGNGKITIESTNNPNQFKISSTVNESIDQEQELTFVTDGNNSAIVKLKVVQTGLRELFITADNKTFVDANGKPFAVLKK